MLREMLVFLIGLSAVLATAIGGFLALRYKDSLHIILCFSAGAVLGVAFFDLLPESLSLVGNTYEPAVVTATVGVGFALFMLLSRWLLFTGSHQRDCKNEHHGSWLSTTSLVAHSFLDGLGIGLAFQVSHAVGLVVAAAVIAHDFSDGINTASLALDGGNSENSARGWVVLDALAPMAGIAASYGFHLSESSLGLVLALFCGFFLYIGASDLLPESHHGHPKAWGPACTVLGMAVIYAAVRFAGG
jgi:zinc transporter ZupT